jgi:hypothetical protein
MDRHIQSNSIGLLSKWPDRGRIDPSHSIPEVLMLVVLLVAVVLVVVVAVATMVTVMRDDRGAIADDIAYDTRRPRP